MAKKLWSNAEIVELGVEMTQGAQTFELEGGEPIYICPYCGPGTGNGSLETNNIEKYAKHMREKHSIVISMS